jgi:hypothetical protein
VSLKLRCMFLPIILAASLPLIATSQRSQAPHATDMHGRLLRALAPPGTQVIVLIFAAIDCPISNRYIPEVARISKEIASSEVAYRWVYPNPPDTASVVAQHAKAYSLSIPVIVDTKQELVRLAHVTVTPEAAVFTVENGQLREQYHGRIDDRYIAFGKERPQATRHDLEDAIKAALAGKPISVPGGKPIGCSIVPVQP